MPVTICVVTALQKADLIKDEIWTVYINALNRDCLTSVNILKLMYQEYVLGPY